MERSAELDRLGRDNPPDPNTVYDVLVLGGGPAATTAAVYAARKMLHLALITYDFQGQVASTSEIENYMGFQTITGRELAEKFTEQAKQFGFPIGQGEYVKAVTKDGGVFAVEMTGGAVYRGRTVVASLGKRDRPLGVPGEDTFHGRGVAYCATCDAPFYRGLKVLVAGGGNSGFTAALDLAKIAEQVTLINIAEGFIADEVLQQQVRTFDNVTFADKTEVVEIRGEQVVTGVTLRDLRTGRTRDAAVDGVFVEIGLIPNSEPLKDLVALNRYGEVVVDAGCATDVEGFFAAGDMTSVPHKQIIISAGEGAKAALSAYEYLVHKGLAAARTDDW